MSGVVATAEALPEIRRLLQMRTIEVTAAGKDPLAAMAIMESVLEAQTEEELFERQQAGTISSKEYTLRPFRLLPENVTWKRSAPGYVEQGGFPLYMLLRVMDIETGKEVTVDTGAPSCIAVVQKGLDWDDEERPIEKRFFERFRLAGGRPLQFVPKPTAAGFDAILLMPVVLPGSESEPVRGKRR